ncbi:DNA cytosine methyltransferase [Treponema sp.]|uniref:DNA cytosine methyltransferase n=1 Tax=Treponema sp. TaxID=166 RepID=UPI003FD7D877
MNVLSLFSGCGGMDIGFEGGFSCLRRSVNANMRPDWIVENNGEWVTLKKTGFTTVFANDIRPDAKAAWISYFSRRIDNAETIYHIDSIVDLVKRAKAGEKVFPDNIHIVTGGFPCQDFSIAGKRNGFNSQKSHNGGTLEAGEPSIESRGQLYIWMRDVVTLTKPLIFIAENVKGLTNLNDVKEIIEHDFANAADGGYIVIPAKVLHAADYGVPQSRERVIFFGFKKSALTVEAMKALTSKHIPKEYDPYPQPTHAYTAKETTGLYSPVTCAEAFVDLLEPDFSTDLSQKKYSKAKYMGKHCQGQNEIKLNSIAPTIRSEHHGNIEYRRLSEEHGGKHLEELHLGMPERRLSVRECARIQTFPDDYQFIIPKKGNNVSVSSSDAKNRFACVHNGFFNQFTIFCYTSECSGHFFKCSVNSLYINPAASRKLVPNVGIYDTAICC